MPKRGGVDLDESKSKKSREGIEDFLDESGFFNDEEFIDIDDEELDDQALNDEEEDDLDRALEEAAAHVAKSAHGIIESSEAARIRAGGGSLLIPHLEPRVAPISGLYANEEEENDDDEGLDAPNAGSLHEMQRAIAKEAIALKRRHRRNSRVTQRVHKGSLPYNLVNLSGEANVHFVNREYPEAIAKCEAIIAAAPGHSDAYALLGLIYQDKGDKDRSVDAYRLAVAASPTDGSLWKRLADASLAIGDKQGAMTACDRSAALNKDDINCVFEAAEMNLDCGQIKGAIKWLKIALTRSKISPKMVAQTKMKLATLYFDSGEVASSRDALTDCCNFCMGTELSTEQDLSQKDPKNDSSSSSLPSLLVPRPELLPFALDACNMLCEILKEAGDYLAISNLCARVKKFLLLTSSSSSSSSSSSASTSLDEVILPIDLTVKYGCSRMHLNDVSGALYILKPLFAINAKEAPDLFLEVGLELKATKKWAASLKTFQKLRNPSIATLSSVSSATAAAPDGDDDSLNENPLAFIKEFNDPELQAQVLESESVCFEQLQRPRRALSRLLGAVQVLPTRLDIAEKAAIRLASCGRRLEASRTLSNTVLIRSLRTESDVATVLLKASEYIKDATLIYPDPVENTQKETEDNEMMLSEDEKLKKREILMQQRLKVKDEYCVIVMQAFGASNPPESANVRVRRVTAAKRAFEQGEKVIADLISNVCQHWIHVGEAQRAARFLELIRQAEGQGVRVSHNHSSRTLSNKDSSKKAIVGSKHFKGTLIEQNDYEEGSVEQVGSRKKNRKNKDSSRKSGNILTETSNLDQNELDGSGRPLSRKKKSRKHDGNEDNADEDNSEEEDGDAQSRPSSRFSSFQNGGIRRGLSSRLESLSKHLADTTTVTDSLVTEIRMIASTLPKHAGIWTLCKLLESRAVRSTSGRERDNSLQSSTAFRKAVIRYAGYSWESVPLLMLLGSDCMHGKSYRLAAAVYYEAFRLAPREPLISLCLASAHLGQVMSRVTMSKHNESLRGLAFLSNYHRLRVLQATNSEQPSLTSLSSTSMSETALKTSTSSHLVTSDTSSSSSSSTSSSSSQNLSYPSVPETLHRSIAMAEAHYNVGRFCHQLGLLTLAVEHYEFVLNCPWKRGTDFDLSGSLDCRKEAAYNLSLILKASGAEVLAAQIKIGNKPSSGADVAAAAAAAATATAATAAATLETHPNPALLASNIFSNAFATSLTVNIGKALLQEAKCNDRLRTSSSNSNNNNNITRPQDLLDDDSLFGSFDGADNLPNELSPKYSFTRAPRLRLSRPPIATGQLESGWMYKLGAVRKTWKKRFFVISQLNENFVVHYYDTEESSTDKRKSRGSILLCGHAIRSLTGLADVVALENASNEVETVNQDDKRFLRTKFLSSSLLTSSSMLSNSGGIIMNDTSTSSFKDTLVSSSSDNSSNGGASGGGEGGGGYYLAIEPLDRRHFSRLWFLRFDTLEQRNVWKHALRYAATRCIAPCLFNALPFANVLTTAASGSIGNTSWRNSQGTINRTSPESYSFQSNSRKTRAFEFINRAVVSNAFDITRAQLGLDGYFKLDRDGVSQLAALILSYCEYISLQDETKKIKKGDISSSSNSLLRKGDKEESQKSLSSLISSSFRNTASGVSNVNSSDISYRSMSINALEKISQTAAETAWPAIQSRAEMSAEPLLQLASSHVPQIIAAESARMKEARDLFESLLTPICDEMVSGIAPAVTGTFLGPLCRAHAEAVTAVWHRLNLIIDRGLREVELRQLFRDAEWQFELLSKALNELRLVTRAGRTGLPHTSSTTSSSSTTPSTGSIALPSNGTSGTGVVTLANTLLQQLHCTYAELVSILSPLTLFEIESEAEASIRANTTRAIYSFVLRVEEEAQEASQLGDIFGQIVKLMAEDAQERIGESIVTIFLKTLNGKVLQKAIDKIPNLKSWLEGTSGTLTATTATTSPSTTTTTTTPITNESSDEKVVQGTNTLQHSQFNRIVISNNGLISTSSTTTVLFNGLSMTEISGLVVNKKNSLAIEAEINAVVTACGGMDSSNIGDLFVSNQVVFMELIEDLIREGVEKFVEKEFEQETSRIFKKVVGVK